MNLDDLLRDYAPLVTSCAKPYVHRHPEWREDIEQEGMLGLVLAARRFDPSRGLKFSTFAHWYVVGLIKHFVRDVVPAVRGPRGTPTPRVYSFEDATARTDGDGCLRDVLGSPDPGIAACEERADLGRAAQALTPLLRGAALAIAAGERYVDVARREGVGRRAFFKRIRRAKEALRKSWATTADRRDRRFGQDGRRWMRGFSPQGVGLLPDSDRVRGVSIIKGVINSRPA